VAIVADGGNIDITTAGDTTIGSIEHRDGDGWKGFELDTSALSGQHGELVAEVSSSGDRRQYCFEADTR